MIIAALISTGVTLFSSAIVLSAWEEVDKHITSNTIAQEKPLAIKNIVNYQNNQLYLIEKNIPFSRLSKLQYTPKKRIIIDGKYYINLLIAAENNTNKKKVDLYFFSNGRAVGIGTNPTSLIKKVVYKSSNFKPLCVTIIGSSLLSMYTWHNTFYS